MSTLSVKAGSAPVTPNTSIPISNEYSAASFHPAALLGTLKPSDYLAANDHPACIPLIKRVSASPNGTCIPKSIFHRLPAGKPNPNLSMDPSGKPRPRVSQAPQKGDTDCWFYASRMVCQRIGKKPLPSQQEPRQIEQWISSRRKALNELDEKKIILLAAVEQMGIGAITQEDAALLVKEVPKSKKVNSEEREGWNEVSPILQEFSKQKKHSDLDSFLAEFFSNQKISINTQFLKQGTAISNASYIVYLTLEEYYNEKFKFVLKDEWVDLNLSNKDRVINDQAKRAGYLSQGLKRSVWHPEKGIDSLIHELDLHGPLLVTGQVGQAYYKDDPQPLPEKVNGETVYGWPAKSPRIDRGTELHVIAITGACSKTNHVYYCDPLDGSDPKKEKHVRTYATSYAGLLKNISDMFDLKFFRKKDQPAFRTVVDGCNEYAMYGDPKTAYL